MCLSLPCRRHPSSAGSFCLEISFSFSLLFWNSDDVHCLELADPFLPWSCSQSQESHSHQLGRIYLRYRREKFGGGGGFKKIFLHFIVGFFFFIISWVFLGLKLELIISPDSQCTAGSLGLAAQIPFRKDWQNSPFHHEQQSGWSKTPAELLDGLILNFPATESQQEPLRNVQSWAQAEWNS